MANAEFSHCVEVDVIFFSIHSFSLPLQKESKESLNVILCVYECDSEGDDLWNQLSQRVKEFWRWSSYRVFQKSLW